MKKFLSALLISLLVSVSAYCAPAAQHIPESISGYQLTDGTPNAGGSIAFYTSDALSTLKAIYLDAQKTNAISQTAVSPVGILLNDSGQPVDGGNNPVVIFGDGTYWAVLKDSSGNTVDTMLSVYYSTSYEDEQTVVTLNATYIDSTTLTDGTATITGGAGSGFTTIAATTVNATALSGTLQTAAQANITSVGDLTALNIDGTASISVGGKAVLRNENNAIWVGAYNQITDSLKFSVRNVEEAMTINDSGNVGIGVTPETWDTYKALQIGQAGAIWSYPSANDMYFSNNIAYKSAAFEYINDGYGGYCGIDAVGKFQVKLAPSGTAGNGPALVDAMTIYNSGVTQVNTTTGVGDGSYTLLAQRDDASSVGFSHLSCGADADRGAIRVGGYWIWVDDTGDLRIKSGVPSSDTDGTVVGTQN